MAKTWRPFRDDMRRAVIAFIYLMAWHARLLSNGFLLQECFGHFGPPDSEPFITSLTPADRGIFIHQITIGIVLNHELIRLPPVVEDPATMSVSRRPTNE